MLLIHHAGVKYKNTWEQDFRDIQAAPAAQPRSSSKPPYEQIAQTSCIISTSRETGSATSFNVSHVMCRVSSTHCWLPTIQWAQCLQPLQCLVWLSTANDKWPWRNRSFGHYPSLCSAIISPFQTEKYDLIRGNCRKKTLEERKQ